MDRGDAVTFTLTRDQAFSVSQILSVAGVYPAEYLTPDQVAAYAEARRLLARSYYDDSVARGRPTSMGVKVIDRNPRHTRVTVFIGRTPGSRGKSGELTLRSDEFDEMVATGELEIIE